MNILIAGDYYPGVNQDENTLTNSLKGIQRLCSDNDYCIVNFESPITSKWDSPISKCGPCLKSNEETVEYLKNIGFNCVTLANNHVLDQGNKTLKYTIDVFKNKGIDIVGAGCNLKEAQNILYKNIKDQRLAIINCCENEFSIAKTDAPGANPLNPVEQYYTIKKARENADFILVIVHGGNEHYPLPSPRMKKLYRYFVDCGADAVINHHQHCYSGYEIYQNKPIIYGIGNLLFDGGNRTIGKWHEGYMVKLIFEKSQIEFELIPYNQYKNGPFVEIIKDKTEFNSEIQRLNKIISNDTLLKQHFEDFEKNSKGMYKRACIPYNNRFLIKAANLGWVPNGMNKEHLLRLLNYIECEAHRDSFIFFLKENCLSKHTK